MGSRTRTLAAVLGIPVLSATLVACSGGGKPAPAPAVTSGGPAATPTTPAAPATHPFTGGRSGLGNPVLAVKIDNTRPARPQQGLRSADIVYVEQVEGGETRIMAIFSSKLPARLGPVRSARISDLHILRQYGRPAFAFSGVQSKMKPYIRRAPVGDVSQDNGGTSYFRVSGRPMPYNLFTSPKALLAQASKATTGPKDIGFRFGPPPDGGKATKGFTARWPSDQMSFTWSAGDRRWLVSHFGAPDQAAEGGRLGAPTIVVQYARTGRSRFHDFLGSYTPLIETTGTGKALVLRDGKSYDARWSRPAEDQGTTFTTASGSPMTFAPGQVWVVLVNDGKPRIP
ncbi:MAG: hypothetical protein JWO67_7371 [Streptosporangiaceae bacterium]|nr:hypothetical protein [Streptosporangiaceae bacterium]